MGQTSISHSLSRRKALEVIFSAEKSLVQRWGKIPRTSPKTVSQTPGHGTSYGTNFAGGVGQWKPKKKGVSKKMLGLGVGAGFLGGAALGVAGTMASYSVYHKYQVVRPDLLIFETFDQRQLHDLTCCRSSRGRCT